MSWSADDKLLLTTSADGVAWVWDATRGIKDPLLVMEKTQHNFKPKEVETVPNDLFGKDSLGANLKFSPRFCSLPGALDHLVFTSYLYEG